MLFEKQIISLYRKNLYVRNDNEGGIFYFDAEDFPGLQRHPYCFSAQAGHTLQGFFYHYDNPIPDRILVFDHGMGNGHRAYFREIERLCRAGFLVFAYDHTGCMRSGGESCNGFAQSLSDLDDCFQALKAEPKLAGRSFSVMGHSWGGFSTMNISALHPEITHVVSMSGFVSVKQMLRQLFAGFLKGAASSLYAVELRSNPKYATMDSRKSLADTGAKVLLIYSDDDKTVRKQCHFDLLQEALSEKENIRFLLVEGKDHNPSYTVDAVRYKDAFFAAYQKAKKRKQLETPEQQKAFMAGYDWLRMTQQDEEVWAQILQHLEV